MKNKSLLKREILTYWPIATLKKIEPFWSIVRGFTSIADQNG